MQILIFLQYFLKNILRSNDVSRDSMQMLHHLNLKQSSIQNNILSIKTQMTEIMQA